MDDGGVAAVEALDPLPGEMGVGDVGVDPATGGQVPLTHPRQLQTQKRAQGGGNLAKRSSLLIPRVAKRGVAVANVYGSLRDAHAMGKRAAAAEDNVSCRELKPFDGKRIEGKQTPELVLADTQPLKRRGGDRVLGEASIRTLLIVEQREDRSLRVE